MTNTILQDLRRSARYCRSPAVRQKLSLFERALVLGEVLRACTEIGKRPRYYYYWWNRYRDSGFDLKSLERKTHVRRAPSKKNSPQAKRWIRHYRERFHYSPEIIRLHLEQKHQIVLSTATVYRILRQEGFGARRKKTRALKPSRKIKAAAQGIPSLPSISTDQATAPFVPRSIGRRYDLEEELGRGGSGIVYRAQDRRRGEQKVALKVVGPLQPRDEALVNAIKNEFRTLAALHHPHLGRVLDFGQEGEELYFSSELIEGQDILSAARGSNFNLVFQWILQTLRGLDYLHSRGVLHLDLKPQNILIAASPSQTDTSVKIIDFGNALWLKKGANALEDFTGTPPYTAPEIILEQEPCIQSDLYSLGILFHQIFCEGLPFSSSDPLAIMKEQVYADPAEPQGLHPALPESFGGILHRLIAREPERRFPNVSALLKAINESLGENFSLRGESAPARILEESDWLFHQDLFAQLQQFFSQNKSQVVVLAGPEGSGKSHLARKLREVLQLKGIAARWSETQEDLDALLKKPKAENLPALLIDAIEFEAQTLIPLLSSLENLNIPVLLCTRLPRSMAMNPHAWFDLQRLSASQLGDFLEHEISSFPAGLLLQNLLDASLGIPLKIESVLQALREESCLQWSAQGWRWTAGDSPPDFTELELRQASRWEDRWQELREILNFSNLPLDGRTLEGMLGLEFGALEEKLAEWARLGRLQVKRIKKNPHYFLTSETETPKANAPEKNWDWALQNLVRLYESSSYDTGARWTEVLISQPSAETKLPDRVALWGARHFVLAGQIERAEGILPKNPPPSESERGLYFEVLSRIHWGLGRMDAAQEAMLVALAAFDSAKDCDGVARVSNLKGLLLKSLGDLPGATTVLTEAVKVAEQGASEFMKGFALMNLGTIYHDQGDYPRAAELYRDAIEVERDHPHPLLSCKLRHNWLNLMYHSGKFSEAETASYDLLKAALRFRYLDQEAAAWNYLGLLAGQKGQNERQVGLFQQALSLLNPKLFPLLYTQILLNRGFAQWGLKHFTAAQFDGESALAITDTQGDTVLRPLGMILIGRILRDRPKPDWEAATHYFNRAHEAVWRLKNRPLLWELEFDRGLLAKKKSEKDRALRFFLSAKEALEDFLKEIPEDLRQSYLRDRKMERIDAEIQSLQKATPELSLPKH